MSKTGVYSMSYAVSESESSLAADEIKRRNSFELCRELSDTMMDGREYLVRAFPPEATTPNWAGIVTWRITIVVALANIKDALVGDCVRGSEIRSSSLRMVTLINGEKRAFSIERIPVQDREMVHLWRRTE